MKKFYSFLFAAVALVGFAACNSDSTEEPAPAGVEKVSFKANIENTKTGLDAENKTTWVAGDVVKVNGFNFICEDDLTTFTCTETGCSALEKETSLTAVYNEAIDSTKGTAGAKLVGEGNLTDGISFQIKSAFLKFTTTGAVTLKGAGLFSTGDTFEVTEAVTDMYVAINPAETTLSYEIDGETCKEVTKEFVAGKIYNLGELVKPEPVKSEYGVVGSFQGWDAAAPVAMYEDADGWVVAKGVELYKSDEFKIVKGTRGIQAMALAQQVF